MANSEDDFDGIIIDDDITFTDEEEEEDRDVVVTTSSSTTATAIVSPQSTSAENFEAPTNRKSRKRPRRDTDGDNDEVQTLVVRPVGLLKILRLEKLLSN
jgi:hypothetical protein